MVDVVEVETTNSLKVQKPPKPSKPPKPPKPPVPSEPSKFETKYTVLTKKINNVVYELLVKTHTDQVYDKDGYTLTEKLSDIFDLLSTSKNDIEDIKTKYDEMFKDAPETFNTFKEIWDYVNVKGDPKSELIKLIESKQAKEEGKGLSTNDFTDILYEKLKNDYSKEELDKRFEVIADSQNKVKIELDSLKGSIKELTSKVNENNVQLVTNPATAQIDNGDMWFQVITKDA